MPRSVTGESPPMHTKAPSLWHGSPTLHDSQLARWAKKANRRARSVLPPRGRCAASSSPRPTVQPQAQGLGLHVKHLACRFLRAKKTDHHGRGTPPPTVTRLPASTKSNSPVSHAGARTHESSTASDSPWVQRSQTAARANTAPPREAVEDGEVKFSKLMQLY
jgi:hypothetical protein